MMVKIHIQMHSLSGDLYRFDLAIPFDKLPLTPAHLAVELAALFNIAQNGTNINLFTANDILVDPLNATHQNHVNIAGSQFFSHVLNFPSATSTPTQQLAISFTDRNDQHVRVTVRSPVAAATTPAATIDWSDYFKNNAFSHPHCLAI